MLDFQNISVRYGFQDVLSNVTFRVNKGERVGVVGPNGSGKSTLFKIVLGELSTDQGELIIEENPRIGSTRQHPEPDTPEETLLEYSMRGVPGFHELEQRMHALEAALDSLNGHNGLNAPNAPNALNGVNGPNGLEGKSKEQLLKEYGEVQTAFEHLGGYDLETRVKVALGGLGFATEEFAKPFASFSGGWRMRAELSRVLASEPDLLLLDEPSNYLDLPAVDWLQRYLKQYHGTLMLISHDRYLLRTLTDIIVEVDAETATRYEGNLDWYLREREVRYQHLLAAKENQDHHREQLQRFVDRFRAQATKAAQAQSRQKLIDKIDEARIVLPKRYSRRGRLRLAEPPPSGIEMFRCENLFFTYDGVKNVLHDVSFSISRGDKVALIGYNGLGKSTLMRLIAGTRQPTSGKAILGHNVVPGYLSQEFAETIPPDLSVYRVAKNAWQGSRRTSPSIASPRTPGKARRTSPARRTSATSSVRSVSMKTTWKSPQASFPAARRYVSPSCGSSSRRRTSCCWTSRPRISISTGASSCRRRYRPTRARSCSFRTTSSSCGPWRLPCWRSRARASVRSRAATTTTWRRRRSCPPERRLPRSRPSPRPRRPPTRHAFRQRNYASSVRPSGRRSRPSCAN